MKAFARIALAAVMLSVVYGCASSDKGFEARLTPPEAMNPVFLRYKELPGQKVFVVAVDPTGQWAFGYDHSQATLAEAAKSAATKCDVARKKHQVFTQAKLFAVNNEVVYYNDQK